MPLPLEVQAYLTDVLIHFYRWEVDYCCCKIFPCKHNFAYKRMTHRLDVSASTAEWFLLSRDGIFPRLAHRKESIAGHFPWRPFLGCPAAGIFVLLVKRTLAVAVDDRLSDPIWVVSPEQLFGRREFEQRRVRNRLHKVVVDLHLLRSRAIVIQPDFCERHKRVVALNLRITCITYCIGTGGSS